MKKIAVGFILIGCAFFSFQTFAQVNNHKSNLGLYIGPNFSNIEVSSPQLSADSRSGYQAGFFLRSGKLLYGQAGLQYQVMKSNFAMPDSSGKINGDVMFRRLQLPLYGGLNLMPILKTVFNIRAYAGPVISYDMNIPANTLDFEPSDFNRFRVEGLVGAGFDVLIFSLDAGYSFGINDLFSNDFSGKADYAFVNVGLKF